MNMKMMKTDMEFVTFDAQDVITTSGQLTAMFTVSGDLLDLVGTIATKYNGNGSWGFYVQSASGSQTLKVNGDTAIDNTTWILTENTSLYTGEIITDRHDTGTLNVTGATLAAAGATADKTLYSLDQILQWLSTNGAKQ